MPNIASCESAIEYLCLVVLADIATDQSGNRSHPCDNCIKRGDTPSCQYAAPGNRRRNTGSDVNQGSPDEMQNRIDRLETLVLSLVTNGSSQDTQNSAAAAAAAVASGNRSSLSNETPQEMDEDNMRSERREDDSEVEQVSKSIGIMKVANDRQIYASEAHWFAILSDIAEVKSFFNEHKKQYDDQMKKIRAQKAQESNIGTSMLFKSTSTVDRAEILANFPPRQIANQLIARYFDTENPAAHIVHRPTFRRQYEHHWTHPDQSSFAWLAMSFAMMSLAFQSYHRAGDEPTLWQGQSWDQSLKYLEWTSQCIVTADFTQPVLFMVEALCLYLQAEHARSRDAETGVWILIGIIVRLAMRIGLHRDPKPFASLSPFQSEMRRRVWNFVRSSDILMSTQVQMPSLIKAADCDTEFPTNINDDDFDEDTQSMPPSRPLSENTPISFMIINSDLTFMLGSILESVSSIQAPSFETAMKLDNDLREVRTHIPPHLQMKSREEQAFDSPSIIMQRHTLDLLYHKGQVMLHRKFLTKARENSKFDYSRRTCIDSCMEMLNHQFTLHTECQPGGVIHKLPWSVTSTLAHGDFLLAAMMVCLDMYFTAEAESKGEATDEGNQWTTERRDSMFSAIENAVSIWDSLRDQSMEAYKASTILTVMLDKLRNHRTLRQQLNANFSFVPQPSGVAVDAQVAPEHSAAMTLGMMSSGVPPDAMPGMYQHPQQQSQTQGQVGQSDMASMPGVTTSAQQQQGAPTAPMMTQPGDALGGFSNLFGPLGGGFPLEQPADNLDWNAWANLVQGPSFDDPQNMIFDSVDPAFNTDAANAVSQAQQGQPDASKPQQPGAPVPPQMNNPYGNSNNYFMGQS
ncbi:MAG: hypothetical protein M1831_000603 [Alyxoria varia]|nr:MAG: hypothetical protein M1831_000603 [Alyxoria varia]